MSKSLKLMSIDCTLTSSEGTNDAQKKKLSGVSKKQNTEVKAERVTDKARLPRASIEKKLEALPPGHEATRIMPNAVSLGG